VLLAKRARVLLRRGNTEDAARDLTRAAATLDDDVAAGRAADPARAQRRAAKARFLLGVLAFRRGKFSDAEAHFGGARAQGGALTQAVAAAYLGLMLAQRAGQTQQALVLLQQGRADAGDAIPARERRAMALTAAALLAQSMEDPTRAAHRAQDFAAAEKAPPPAPSRAPPAPRRTSPCASHALVQPPIKSH